MLVPVVGGNDKTTVSAATGQQEYHPVYVSSGNISNVARRSHGSGVLPVALLPIPKGLLLYSSFVEASQVFRSQQKTTKESGIQNFSTTTLPHMSRSHFRPSQTLHREAKDHSLSRWSFPSSHL